MAKKSYDEVKVLRSLGKKRDVVIDAHAKVIKVVKDTTECGNGTWGKIDYLVHYCGYIQMFFVPVAGYNKQQNVERKTKRAKNPNESGVKPLNKKLRTLKDRKYGNF